MLTPQQIESLSLTTEQLMQPVIEFLIDDIARRVSEAGQFTSSAAYQIWRAQALGVDRKTIEKELQKKLNVSNAEVKKLLKQSAEVGYNFDMKGFGEKAIPFSENKSLQQIIEAAMKMSNDTFKNLTQTIGFVDPYGNAKGLTEAYQSSCDFAFNQVVTGATDYNTAIRNATKNLADKGILSIDYESGIHTSLEAAVRRNIMGGLGLMQEQISQQNHDAFGADGWEISAHSASAPDHEDIQGKQYTDAEFEALNNSLTRRIGTLNCGHAAFPIILGVSEPQYTEKQLKQFKEENKKGVTYNGKHYTTYEATQKQRQIERAIRRQKRRVMVAKGLNDKEAQLISKAKLRRLNEEYKRYSDAVGLPLQRERTYIGKIGKVVETKPIVEKKKPSYAPAKTVEEAEEYARKMFGESVDYNGLTVKQANELNEALFDLQQKHPTTPYKQIKTTKMKPIARASDESLEINPSKFTYHSDSTFENLKKYDQYELANIQEALATRKMSPAMRKKLEKQAERLERNVKFERWSAVLNNPTTTVYHEYGHTLASQKFGGVAATTWNDKFGIHTEEALVAKKKRDLLNETYETARNNGDIFAISKYADTDADEFFAETFAMHMTGEVLPEYIEKMLAEVLI